MALFRWFFSFKVKCSEILNARDIKAAFCITYFLGGFCVFLVTFMLLLIPLTSFCGCFCCQLSEFPEWARSSENKKKMSARRRNVSGDLSYGEGRSRLEPDTRLNRFVGNKCSSFSQFAGAKDVFAKMLDVVDWPRDFKSIRKQQNLPWITLEEKLLQLSYFFLVICKLFIVVLLNWCWWWEFEEIFVDCFL